METNKIIHGNNLDVLRGIDSETVDLIYLDPPFASNRDYVGEAGAFTDKWAKEPDPADWAELQRIAPKLAQKIEAMCQ